MKRREALALLLAGGLGSWAARLAAQGAKRVGPDARQWDAVVDRAVAYLRTSQGKDGGWDTEQSPGITGIVLTGLLRTGRVDAKDPMVEKGLKYVESLINRKAGHIAGRNPHVKLQNYVTSVNVMALTAAGRDSYKAVIADAARFLRKLQWDEQEGKIGRAHV